MRLALTTGALVASFLVIGCGSKIAPSDSVSDPSSPFPGLEFLVLSPTATVVSSETRGHVAGLRPMVLSVMNLQSEAQFNDFHAALARDGLTYSFTRFVTANTPDKHIGILAMQEPSEVILHSNLTYKSEGEAFVVRRPFTELQFDTRAADSPKKVILLAHLKSTTFHPANQYEMRRNEARLLGNRAQKILALYPNAELLVAGVLQDDPDSANLKAICRDTLVDLRPADAAGAVWTTMVRNKDTYRRTSYLLATTNLAARIPPSGLFINTPLDINWSLDHRPLAVELFEEEE